MVNLSLKNEVKQVNMNFHLLLGISILLLLCAISPQKLSINSKGGVNINQKSKDEFMLLTHVHIYIPLKRPALTERAFQPSLDYGNMKVIVCLLNSKSHYLSI